MLSFILRRVLVAIPTIILISVFVFTMQKLLPGILFWPWRAKIAILPPLNISARNTA